MWDGDRVAESRGQGACLKCPWGSGLGPGLQVRDRQETRQEGKQGILSLENRSWQKDAICVRKTVTWLLVCLLLGPGGATPRRCMTVGKESHGQCCTQHGSGWGVGGTLSPSSQATPGGGRGKTGQIGRSVEEQGKDRGVKGSLSKLVKTCADSSPLEVTQAQGP